MSEIIAITTEGIARRHGDTVTLAPLPERIKLTEDGQLPDGIELTEQEQADALAYSLVPSLEEKKLQSLTLLKSNRISAERGGFTFNGKRFQTRNEIDIINITNVGIAAMADPTFKTAFRAEDNSWVPMDATTAMQFYRAMVTAGGTIWQLYGAKEAQVLAATTVDDLAAIDLTIPLQ